MTLTQSSPVVKQGDYKLYSDAKCVALSNEDMVTSVRQMWDMIYVHGNIVEVRALLKEASSNAAWEGFGSTIQGYFNDFDSFLRYVTALNKNPKVKAIYATLNPVRPELLARANNRLVAAKTGAASTDNDIVSRRLLMIDCDPIRPADISSSEAELAAAIERANEVKEALDQRGWPAPVVALSGNGAHLDYAIDLPNDKASADLLSDVLQSLQFQFGDTDKADDPGYLIKAGEIGIKIDRSTFNASRVDKVYGTMARKGDEVGDRVHRPSFILEMPEQLDIIPVKLLQAEAQIFREYREEKEQARKEKQEKARRPQQNGQDKSSVIETYNEAYRIEDVLESLGYHHIARNRYSYPAKPESKGVLVDYEANKSKHFSDNDPLYSRYRQSPFSVLCVTEHNGDAKAAVKAAAQILGMAYKTAPKPKAASAAVKQAPVAPVEAEEIEGIEQVEETEEDSPATLDDVLAAINAIGADKDLTPAKRLEKISRELSVDIGKIDRGSHILIEAALVEADAGFKPTKAAQFVKNCAMDEKKRRKDERRHRTQAAKQSAGDRPFIEINRQLSEITADALDAIVEKNGDNPTTFVRAATLTRIVQDERGQHLIQEINGGALLNLLSNVADWGQTSEDENGDQRTRNAFPPKDAVASLLNDATWTGIPGLAGIVHAPVFSRNGKLQQKPGYDPDTRLYYTGGVTLGDITPTAKNVAHAKRLILDELLVDFPCKDDASRAHAVGYMLSPHVREMIDGPVPVTNVDSSTPGTGKGKLLNALGYAYLGNDVPTMAAASTDDEWRKRLTASFLAGQTHLIIDNVNAPLDSGVLASAFTQPVWEDRELGGNRLVRLPIKTIWAITANNIMLSQELARRCVWVRLDANMEKPWERTGFKHENLIGWARTHRNELATAAITLVNAWLQEGKPKFSGRAKGSFEAWTSIIGGILQVAEIPGFLENENELYDRVVTKNDAIREFILAWWGKYADKAVSSNDLFKLASVADDDNLNRLGEYKNLLADVLTAPRQRGRQTQLGKILDENRDKIVAGFKIEFAKVLHGTKWWNLEPVGEPTIEVHPANNEVHPTKDQVHPANNGQTLGEPHLNVSKVHPTDCPLLPPVAGDFLDKEVNLGEPLSIRPCGEEKKYNAFGHYFFSDSNTATGEESSPRFTQRHHLGSIADPNFGKTELVANGEAVEIETGISPLDDYKLRQRPKAASFVPEMPEYLETEEEETILW